MLSPDDVVAEKVKDIQAACRTLEDIGYNSLVVITIEQRHIEIGSAKGRQFYEENHDIIEKFVKFCQDDGYRLQNNSVNPTLVFERDSLSSLNQYTVHMIKPETAADESIDLVKEKSVFFKEFDNDVKPIKTENKSGSDPGQKDGIRNDENLDNLKSESIDDNDDADSELSAVDDDDADDSGGEYMYNNGTDIITVRPINTENIVKTEQNDSTKVGDDKAVVSIGFENKGRDRKRFPCDQCDKTYARKEDLVCHKRKHTGESPYPCNNCELSFRSNKMLNNHKCRSPDVGKTKCKVCEVCGDTFKRQADLVVHKRKHSGEAPYECSDCGKRFRSQQFLRNHQLTHSNKDTFLCDQCDKRYVRKEDLVVHQRKHTGEAPYTCDDCQRSFRSNKMLNNHKCRSFDYSADVGETNTKVCEVCGDNFKRQSDLVVHMRKHSGEAPYECVDCGKRFRSRQYMRNHQKTHSNKGMFPCNQCDKKYARKEDLIIHQRKHSGELPYPCGNCQRSFRSNNLLRKHNCRPLDYSTQVGDAKSKICEVCGVRCLRQSDLVVHMRKHTGEAPFECLDCGKRFRSPHYLRNHQLTHSNKDMFLCDQCDKRYARKEDLIIHQRKHSGERPFCCQTCGKRFISPNCLRSHIIVHLDTTPYGCKECSQQFAKQSYLTRHMKSVHSNVYSFVCETCGRSFKDSQGLYNHRLTHTQKKFACGTCGKRFLRQTALNSHKLIHTGVKPYVCTLCSAEFRMKKNLATHQRRKHALLSGFLLTPINEPHHA